MKINKSATITISFTNEDEIDCVNKAREISNLKYREIFLIGVKKILESSEKD
tara:strand:+ start:279 stop:434 length:156 start_codon:yes stop_codon:yes gene_type:complete